MILEQDTFSTEYVRRSPAAIRIVIADDERLFRAGLRSLLATESEFRVEGETGDGAEVLEMLRATGADVLLLDPGLGAPDCHALLDRLQSAATAAKTIIVTDHSDPEEIMSALAKGARGVVLKHSPVDRLKDAIRAVYRGQVWVDLPSIVARSSAHSNAKDVGDLILARHFWTRLTPRERQIASLLAQGHRCPDIAARLSITPGTVKSHLHRVYMKLRVTNRQQLVLSEIYSQLRPESGLSRCDTGLAVGRVA